MVWLCQIYDSYFSPVIFFGESIPPHIKARSCVYLLFFLSNETDMPLRISNIETADRLMIIGSTLATYSAFRLLKRALELNKPVLILNLGPTRADDQPKVEKIEIASGKIIREVARNIL